MCLSRLPCKVLLVKCPPYQRLDHCLPADIQFVRLLIQLLKHGQREINVQPLPGSIIFPGFLKK